MVENVIIRKMTKDDLDRIIEIEEGAYGSHHWPKSSFIEELNNKLARYYVLEDENNFIAGYAGCWHILDIDHAGCLSLRRGRYNQLGSTVCCQVAEVKA